MAGVEAHLGLKLRWNRKMTAMITFGQGLLCAMFLYVFT